MTRQVDQGVWCRVVDVCAAIKYWWLGVGMRSISKTFEMGRPVEVVGPIHMREALGVSGDRAPCNPGNGTVTRSSTGVGLQPGVFGTEY